MTSQTHSKWHLVAQTGVCFTLSCAISVAAHAESAFDGAYVGVNVGAGAIETELTGPRDGGTSQSKDLSDSGLQAGLFAGYGTTFDRFYLGGDLEASISNQRWSSVLNNGGRIQDVTKPYEGALTLRGGYLVNDKTLIYGRLGGALASFDSSVRVSQGTTFKQTDNLLGLRLGAGAEIALQPNLGLLVDYVYTAYPSYNQNWTETVASGPDHLENSDSAIRVGLAYHFSPDGTTDWESTPLSATLPNLPGFYAGGQLAYETLMTLQKGPRETSDYKRDELGDGTPAGGLFAGYGTYFDRWYVGTEWDVTLSNQTVSDKKLPGGRVNDVIKHYDTSGSLRFGYLLDGGVLAYGRVGLAVAEYNTEILLGDGRSFDQSDTQIGARIGGGAEIPLSGNWFTRLDYTYTRYNGYIIDRSSPGQTTSGDLQLENFRNDESTVRLGLAYHFGMPEQQTRTASAPLGYVLQKFVVLPRVLLSETYDDNIFSTRSNTKSDYITTLTPSVEVKSNLDRHVLNMNASTSVVRYRDNGTENYNNYTFGADGRFDITEQSNVYGGASYLHDHESRDSADDVNGSKPTEYSVQRTYAGGYHRTGDAAVRVAGSRTEYDFKDAPSTNGTINNDDRDRTITTGGVWGGYYVQPRVQAYGQVAVDDRSYKQALDDNNQDRDSNGYRVWGGVKMDLPRGSTLDAHVGYLTQDYDDVALKDVTAPTFGADLKLIASQATTMNAYLNRALSETTTRNASSTLDTTVGAGLVHNATQDLALTADFSATTSQFQGIDRADDIYVVGTGIKYALTSNIAVGADYSFRTQDSTVAAQSYTGQQLSLHLNSEF